MNRLEIPEVEDPSQKLRARLNAIFGISLKKSWQPYCLKLGMNGSQAFELINEAIGLNLIETRKQRKNILHGICHYTEDELISLVIAIERKESGQIVIAAHQPQFNPEAIVKKFQELISNSYRSSTITPLNPRYRKK